MYKVSVPVMNSIVKRSNREALLKEIKRFNAERIYLALDTYELDTKKRLKALSDLADNCKFFKENGFEVGAWIWTFLIHDNTEFGNMRTIGGNEINKYMCPTDENFVKFATDYISDVAKCGVDIILFDDDFRYGSLSAGGPACLCDKHIEIINGITGENSTREELYNYITTGGKNKFRDAYLKANGDAFRNFATAVRQSVDKVNPEIRIGNCACMSSWDINGVDAYELSKILAGNTKPLARLSGAPFWAVTNSCGNRLQDAIEQERLESTWTRQGDIELMAEGDAYPRPRINCPASYLEGFDTAIRVSGCTDGILKYGIDYFSNADYEKGYALFSERNAALYTEIEKYFGNKTSCGVRIYESMKKIADSVIPTKVNNKPYNEEFIWCKAARTFAATTIPTVYEGDGVTGAVFDENARNMPLSALKNGLILDIAAAEILTERGVDVGLLNIGESIVADEEHFIDDNNYISAVGALFYDIKIKENAEVLSDADTQKGKIPVSYRYENADGQRFLVLNINTRYDNSSLLKHYARSRQYAENIPWLSGKKLPAYVYGNPYLYIQCKKGENSMAVGLWNFFADAVSNPVIELNKNYKEIKFINCDGKLKDDKVYLTDIMPFGFVGFEVTA